MFRSTLLQHSSLLFLLLFLFSCESSSQTVFKTPSGRKYHLSSCKMVKNVSEEINIETAKKLGLQPCLICKPVNIYSANTMHKAKGQAKKTVQCSALTKAGTRCKHMTSIANGYCYQHQPE